MQLNLPGNTGITPCTYLVGKAPARVRVSRAARLDEWDNWRTSLITQHTKKRARRADNWMRKHSHLIK
jgi:hypothetical protein